MKKKPLIESFRFAGQGFKTAFCGERNFRIHCTVGTIVIIAGIALGLSVLKWALLFTAVGVVLVSELINTAGETLVDMVTKEYSPEAKKVKDLLASSVLVSAITAALIGIFVFFDPLMDLFKRITGI